MFSFKARNTQYRLGELLIEKRLINEAQLVEAIALQKQSEGKQLGQILIEHGYITARQLSRALRRQERLRLFATIITFWLSLFGGAGGAMAATTTTTTTGTGTTASAVTTALSVTSQPANTTLYEGQSQTFSIAATSSKAITYTWTFNGTRVGSNSSTLPLSNVTTANAGTYSCSVTDGTTTVACTPFTLTVNRIVRISTQPSSMLVSAGTWQRLSVAATGTGPLSFQWYKNGAPLTGATSTSITFKSITSANAGSYYCVIKNAGSTATSSTATIRILSAPQTYSLRLTWAQATQRQDGSALPSSEIAGYNLYYSNTATGSMSRIATLSASDLSYFASGLSAGTHFFAATTVDIRGLESPMSTKVSQTIQ